MTQEEKLQKRLNEICFPGYKMDEEFDKFHLYKGKKLDTKCRNLLPITLELVLKALQIKYSKLPKRWVIEYNSNTESIMSYDDIGGKFTMEDIDYLLLTPFSLLPTETKNALFKIFEITDN